MLYFAVFRTVCLQVPRGTYPWSGGDLDNPIAGVMGELTDGALHWEQIREPPSSAWIAIHSMTDQMGCFIRRLRPRANELGLQFTKGEGGVEATIFAPCGKGKPLLLKGMRPDWAISTARDLALELGVDVAVMDEAGLWDEQVLGGGTLNATSPADCLSGPTRSGSARAVPGDAPQPPGHD